MNKVSQSTQGVGTIWMIDADRRSVEVWTPEATFATIESVRGRRYTVEIKRSTAPVVSKGFWIGSADLRATARMVVYGGEESIPLGDALLALGLRDAVRWIGERVGSR